MLFLDRTVTIGHSYSDDSVKVDQSSVTGEDVYVYYRLFFTRFPEYTSAKFHMAAESYGGACVPHAASIVHKRNKELDLVPVLDLIRINLASVIPGSGITEPVNQLQTVADYACNGSYAMYDDLEGSQCVALRSNVSVCERLNKSCYNSGLRSFCVPAQTYCYGQVVGSLQRKSLHFLVSFFDANRT
jgi:cathepsin A (carboxypeptidase C)